MGSFSYVEMMCSLEDDGPDRIDLVPTLSRKPIRTISQENLLWCYLSTFQAGDARFFTLQDEHERRRYFRDELGFPVVLDNPASFAYLLEGSLIGFSLVIPYLEKNYHISCMCILPEHQGKGLGKQMLNEIKTIALENGIQTLSLGTEPGMKAFRLYQKAGFEITAQHIMSEF